MAEFQENFESGADEPVLLAQAQDALFSDSYDREDKLVKLTPEPGGGLWSVARDAFRISGISSPEPTELKELVLDIAERNKISIDATLSPNQPLLVKLPALAINPIQAQAQAQIPAQNDSELKSHVAQRDRPQCSTSWEEVDMIASWVTHNEAGPDSFRAYNPDDNGAGISVGLMQWNQRRGDLPVLVDSWFAKNPRKFNEIFGASSPEVLDEDWLRKVDFSGNPTLRSSMERALADSEFQGVQLALRNEHIEESCEVAKDYGFSSLRARAVVADLVNQLGRQGARSFISRVPDFTGNESKRIEQLKLVTDDRINARDRIEAIEAEVRKIWRLEAAMNN